MRAGSHRADLRECDAGHSGSGATVLTLRVRWNRKHPTRTTEELTAPAEMIKGEQYPGCPFPGSTPGHPRSPRHSRRGDTTIPWEGTEMITTHTALEDRATAEVACDPADKGCAAEAGTTCYRDTAVKGGEPKRVSLKHPHATRMARLGAAITAANAAAGSEGTGADGNGNLSALPGSPLAIAMAKIAQMISAEVRVGDYRVDKDATTEHAEALNLALNNAQPATTGWTVTTSTVRGTGDEDGQTFTRFTIAVPAPKPAGRGRRAASSTTPDVPMFDHCNRCELVYAKPWTGDWCGSERACNRRKAARAAQAELGLPVTVFDQGNHRLPADVKDAEAAIAAKRAELAPASA